jgi:peptidoglycan/LPS O-acetylase OafA/YrhL
MAEARSLEDVFNPHHNSLTFLRLVFAIALIVSQSYEIGGYGLEPFKWMSSVPLKTVVADSFFAMSGFLIVASYFNSSSVKSYLWKRFLRIFPGFWICLIVIGLILCPTLYWIQYGSFNSLESLGGNQFIGYVLINSWLRISKVSIYHLFKDHPVGYLVNDSLWSLFPLFLCYLGIVLAGWTGLLKNRKALILFFVSLLLLGLLKEPLLQSTKGSVLYDKVLYIMQTLRVAAYFTSGALLYLYRSQVPFTQRLFLASLSILILSLGFKSYSWVAPFCLSYVTIASSILLPFHKFGKYGDYSYGLYIYAYPIQQTIYFFNPDVPNVFAFVLLSMVFTLPVSWLSWNLIEQPCLKLKTLKL